MPYRKHCLITIKTQKDREYFYLHLSAINTGRITRHSGFGSKPGTKLLGINGESNVIRNRLLEMKCLISDEI